MWLTLIHQHPPFCPIHHLDEEGRDSLPPEIVERGVDVGVAVLLESSDHKLLLTHRAPHMRTFPSIWVPPGGHVGMCYYQRLTEPCIDTKHSLKLSPIESQGCKQS